MPAYSYDLKGVDKWKFEQLNMEHQGIWYFIIFKRYIFENSSPKYSTQIIPMINVLAEFLVNPGDHRFIPGTTSVEPNP